MRVGVLGRVLAAFAVVMASASAALSATPIYGFRVVHTYPHDPTAFTEGLFYLDGRLYESTGLEGRSSIREEVLTSGKILEQHAIAPQYFGEGIVAWKHHLIELTWKSEVGFVYDLATFKPISQFHYTGEGWSLTRDEHRLIMSDGTPQLRFLDPETLKETGRIEVTDQGRLIANLNELEFVKGEVFANIWQTDVIARIDPNTGKVLGWIDLTGLLSDADRAASPVDVLNGIAYDPKGDRLFVTGKLWPKLFEIKLVPKSSPSAPAP